MITRATRALSLAAAATLLAAGYVGCGGDDEDPGPVAVVPESAPVYVEASVRPEGEARDGAEAALGRILDSDDPGPEVIEFAEQLVADEGEEADYEEEIEPWLGERFAVFLTAIGGDTADSKGAFAIETTDGEEALEYLSSGSDSTGRTKEYEGVEYEIETDGDVFGLVDDFIVGGNEVSFKAAVDAADGDSLADSDEFDDAVEDLADDRLATLYVPPEQFLKAIAGDELDPAGRAFVKKALGEAGEQPVLGEVTASEDAITLELSAGGGVETAVSGLLGELPSEAWLAIGFPDVGATVASAVKQAEKVGFPGLDAAAIRRQLRDEIGINLEQEVIKPLGDAAAFVQGTSEQDLGGAVVIETSDPAASGELINKLEDLVSQEVGSEVEVEPLASATGDQGFQVSDPEGGLPQPVTVIQRDGRIIAGYGGAAINQALAGAGGGGTEPLSASPTFKAAEEDLGGFGVDLFLSFAPLLDLAEGFGLGADPDFQEAKPYLEGLEFAAFGSGSEGDRAMARFSIGLE